MSVYVLTKQHSIIKKKHLGGFDGYRNPNFHVEPPWAGGPKVTTLHLVVVNFNTLTQIAFFHFSVQYEFGFRNENVCA